MLPIPGFLDRRQRTVGIEMAGAGAISELTNRVLGLLRFLILLVRPRFIVVGVAGGAIVKQIDSVIALYLGKEDKRQGITASKDPTALSYLYKAMSYVGSLQSEPGSTEMRLVENANNKLDPIIEEINTFYQIEWINYRTLVENVKLSMFKDYETLK